MNALFAQAAGLEERLGGGLREGGAAAEFSALVQMWEVLKLEKALQGKLAAGYHPQFVTALARTRCSPETATHLEMRLSALLTPGVTISGRALVGIDMMPNHLRGSVISHLHVLARLRGEPLELFQVRTAPSRC